MLVNSGRRDERGSALVSVLVMMLVLTLFALTLAALVMNTSKTLAGGRDVGQARAAADAGIAAAVAAFKQAEACTGTIASTTAPVYQVTCVSDASTVTFTSTGSAVDGLQAGVQAVYGYTTAQAFGAKVGQLTYFSATGTYAPNIVTSSTPDPAKVVIADGDFQCKSAMAANLVVEGDFYAYYGCAVSGSVAAKGKTTMYGGSSVGQDLTTGGTVTLYAVSSIGGTLSSGGDAVVYNSSIGKDLATGGHVQLGSGSSVGGNLTSSGYAYLSSGSSVGGDLSAGGYTSLESGTSVGGNLTSTDYSSVDGTVKGNLVSGSYVLANDNSSIAGSVTAAGTDRTWIHGKVGKNVTAAGPVTTHYSSTVIGNVIAAGGGTSAIYGTVGGDFAAAGPVLLDYNGSVGGDTTSAGTGTTSVYGKLSGNLKAAGPVYVDYNGSVGGDTTSAGTATTSVYGKLTGSLKVAGTVLIDYNGTIGADLASSGSGTDNIYGRITGTVNAGGNVYLPAGSVGGDLTLPSSKSLTPSDAKSRIVGNVIKKAGPAAPSAPSAPTVSLTPPVVKVSAPASPTIPKWQDYGYSSADWPGYSTQVLGRSSSWCSSRNWATNLGTFTTPTVIDATGCNAGLSQHPTSMTTVTIKADVVVVSSEIDLQNITFKADAGASPNLWFIVPSSGGSVKRYSGTTSGSGEIALDSSNFWVATLLYTPGQVRYHDSTFTGSMYTADIALDGGTPGDIKAAPLEFPIALFDSTGSSTPPTGTFSVTRISQREVG
jgi:cytoskeletal protein CcmA (bactofilin family)